MLRRVSGGAFRVFRGAALFGGAVVTLALVFGMTSVALGANGGNFILGKSNVATAITKLTGNSNGSTLQISNTNESTNDTALDLRVKTGEPPMKVNSATKITNLNADKVDGLDSSQIVTRKDGWGIINANGTVRNSRDVFGNGTYKEQTGVYRVDFVYAINNCAYTATTTDGNGGQVGTEAIPSDSAAVRVYTYNSGGTSLDLPFHITLAC